VDIITGGDDSDTIYGNGGGDVIRGGLGNDNIQGSGEIYGEDGTDTLKATVSAAHTVLDGGDGNDTLTTDSGVAIVVLRGGAGDDTLSPNDNATSVTLEGGTGNDTLNGTNAADLYVFNVGDGADTIYDEDYSQRYNNAAAKTDRLVFGADITPAMVSISRVDNDLIFTIGSNGDSVRVKTWYTAAYYKIERIEFADGTVWTGGTL
jgi:Ca2+-binding RTX toxin-like protein